MKVFLKSVRSKQILIAGLAVLVAVAGYYRWTVEKNPDSVTVMNNSIEPQADNENIPELAVPENEYTDYFAKARYERDCARTEAAELLAVSTQNNDNDSEQNQKNAEKLAQYAKNTEDETTIENMIIAKGYSDCVAFIDDDGVRVVVKTDALDADGVAKIKDIIIEQTGVKATAIKISNKEK